MVVFSVAEFTPCPFHSLPLFLIDIIKNGDEWTRKLEEQRAPICGQGEEGIPVWAWPQWGIRKGVRWEGQPWERRWPGVECESQTGEEGCVCGWECPGSHSPKNIRRGSSSRDPGVLEPRCGGRSVHMEERVMIAVKRLFTYWGINQRSNHVKGSGKQIPPHHRREKTKQVQGCWTGTESISVNIWLFNIYQGR